MAPALEEVLDALARAVDDIAPGEAELGEIRLKPHQVSGARAVRAAISEFGGALLADEPGLGKTFTALAVARHYTDCVVAAPASLRSMWRDACGAAQVAARFVSLEALSRAGECRRAPLLIVDEAHRAANRSAKRFAALAHLADGAHVLLLTATPVRNRRSELDSLIGLFLGSSAEWLDDASIARCIVKRSVSQLRDIPAVEHRTVRAARRPPRVARQLIELPPPFPVADGTSAAALVSTGLARCWASSLAALDRALARRLQRGGAIRDVLESGRHPSRADLRAWILGDDATQLALPFGDGTARSTLHEQIAVVDAHLAAIRKLRDIVRPRVDSDTRWRAQRLASIARDHRDQPVITFTMFEATAVSLFRALHAMPGVVLLTSRGARSAGGAIRRDDVIRLLGPGGDRPRSDSARFNPTLVISTDVVSEGVNLQRASAVVHLDDPWTPAALAQRTGRVARIGSRNALVAEYRFSPPGAAARLLRIATIHRQKRASASTAMEPSHAWDALRDAVAAWVRPVRAIAGAVVATSRASSGGFIARVQTPARAWLVGGERMCQGKWLVTDDPATLFRLARAVSGEDGGSARKDEIAAISRCVDGWLDRARGAAMAGSRRQPSLAVRRILARLDYVIECSPLPARPAVANRVGSIRDALLGASGAAVELHARSMLGRPADHPGWLAELEERLRRPNLRCGAVGDRPALAALLLLRTAPSTP